MAQTQIELPKLDAATEAVVRQHMADSAWADNMTPEEYAVVYGDELGLYQNQQPENEKPNPEQANSDNDSPEATEATTEATESEQEAEPDADDEEEVSIFQPKKGSKVNFKDEAEAKTHIKDKLGIDISTPQGYAKLVDSFNKQRQNAQKATDYEKKLEGIEAVLAELPEPIIKAMEAHNNGQDWKEPLKGVPALKIDFNKEFDGQDKWALIETYVPDEMTQEEYQDDPNGKDVQRLLRIAEKAFKLDKQQNDRELAEVKRVQDSRKKALSDSALVSVEAVKADFPGIEDKDVKRIEKILLGGGLGSEFFNADGTYKKDAAKKLALIQYAPTEIERLNKQITKLKSKVKELSDTTAEVVSRSRDTVADERGGKSNLQNPELDGIPDWLKD